MRPDVWRSGFALFGSALVLAAAAPAAGEAEDGRAAPAEQLLTQAFGSPLSQAAAGGECSDGYVRLIDNRYEVDTRAFIRLVVRSPRSAPTERRLAMATKRIAGRLHSLGRFTEPEYLRGMTILSIENERGSGDHFVYLRELAKLRRISSSQRADAFMGTDLSFEDFERRRVGDYQLELRPAAQVGGEKVHVVAGTPRYVSSYASVEFWIARSDAAILETRYFKRDAVVAFKVIHTPRADTRRLGGHSLPTHILVENHARGTQTEAWIEQLSIDPGLNDALFTAAAVEVGRPIPGLER